ncbi:unnamed protein product [Amaranthus hypochondriacus]
MIMNKVMLLSIIILLVLVIFPKGSKAEAGICNDEYELFMEPRCLKKQCKELCETKMFYRLLASRCIQDGICQCTQFCRHAY